MIKAKVRSLQPSFLKAHVLIMCLATLSLTSVATAQEPVADSLPDIEGGYVKFHIGKHQLNLERAWTSTKGLPSFHSWKKNQPVVEDWQVRDDQLFYFAQNLEIPNAAQTCREMRVAITQLSPGDHFPGFLFSELLPKARASEVPFLREFTSSIESEKRPPGFRFFFLTHPDLKMSNGSYPSTTCRFNRTGSCGVSVEIAPRLFTRTRFYPSSCGLEKLVETARALKFRLANRYSIKTGE